MDHSRRWVSASSQGLSCAIVAEFLMRNQLAGSIPSPPGMMRQHIFYFTFYLLSNDISAAGPVIEDDCCEMTICNSQINNLTLLPGRNATIMTQQSVCKQGIHSEKDQLFEPSLHCLKFSTEPSLITICDITLRLRNIC